MQNNFQPHQTDKSKSERLKPSAVVLYIGVAVISDLLFGIGSGYSLQVRHGLARKPSPGFPLLSGSPSAATGGATTKTWDAPALNQLGYICDL